VRVLTQQLCANDDHCWLPLSRWGRSAKKAVGNDYGARIDLARKLIRAADAVGMIDPALRWVPCAAEDSVDELRDLDTD